MSNPSSARDKTSSIKRLDLLFLLLGIGTVLTIITRYQMPFRLDDVIYIQWAKAHSFWDAFDIQKGEIFLSFRPVMGMVMWTLAHTSTEQYWVWHLVLTGSFTIAIAFTGLTARLISNKSSALYITALWYPIAFLSILNVLFWYADMTYSLEMMFVSMAWYFGLKSILERRKWMWVVGNCIAILAVFTKEPSILLIHGVWIGSLVLIRKEFIQFLRRSSRPTRALWLNSYLVFLAISVKMLFTSQATSTRFFHIGSITTDQLLFFVTDRIRYYSDTIVTPAFTLLMLLSVMGLVSMLRYSSAKLRNLSVVFSIVTVILFFISKPILFLCFASLIIILIALPGNRNTRRSLLLPFAVIVLINSAVLLVTMMLVKTQIVELSFLLTIIVSCGVSILLSEVLGFIRTIKERGGHQTIFIIAASSLIGIFIVLLPKLKAKEHLLLSVKESRMNSNDAIKWMAKNLPQHSSVLVTAPNLYGISNANDITGMDDEYKLYAQPTFLQGFVRIYFDILDRKDISVGYLEDTTILSRVLDSSRSKGDEYLFLQTEMDIEHFHNTVNNKRPINQSDLLLKAFGEHYQTEVWQLRTN